MKKLLIIGMLLLTMVSFAQDDYCKIFYSKAEVYTSLKGTSFKVHEVNYEDKIRVYAITDFITVVYEIDPEIDMCIRTVLMLKKTILVNIAIKTIEEKYIKVSDIEWYRLTSEFKIKVNLKYYEGNYFFTYGLLPL